MVDLVVRVPKSLGGGTGKRAFDLDATKCQTHTSLQIDKSPEDLYRPLKSVATDLVVNEFFKTDDTLYRFLTFVYTTFEQALVVFREKRARLFGETIRADQLFFIYKGGNLLRIVAKEFLLELPASATREIAQYYAPFFKRGDADYSIYIDPELKNYDTIYHEITLLAYLLQDQIRDWFSTHLMRYFNFFQYNEAYQAQVLASYLPKFNEAAPPPQPSSYSNEQLDDDPYVNVRIGNAVANPSIVDGPYQSNADVTIRFVDPREDWLLPVREAALCVIKENGPAQMMTITHNSSLDFPGGGPANDPVRIKFNLTRTKFIFTLFKASGATENVGGELIDVSIPHRDDDGLPHFFKHLNENLTRYTLHFQDVCELSFIAYSLPYLTYDLENILFVQRELPWEDNKYGKRINRLIYMYFVDAFIALDNSRAKKEVLLLARDLVFLPMANATPTNLHEVSRGMAKFISRYQSSPLLLKQLMLKLEKLTKKVMRVSSGSGASSQFGGGSDAATIAKYNELGALLVENINFLLGALTNIQEYCSLGDGRVNSAELYSANISSLV